VDRLFREAQRRGLRIEQRALSPLELRALVLGGRYLIIALVDKSRMPSKEGEEPVAAVGFGVGLPGGDLRAGRGPAVSAAAAAEGEHEVMDLDDEAEEEEEERTAVVAAAAAAGVNMLGVGEEASAPYIGHYILIRGYCPARDAYLISDPAATVGDIYVEAAVLHTARKSFGTDEDLLLVSREGVAGATAAAAAAGVAAAEAGVAAGAAAHPSGYFLRSRGAHA
jgi:hypothetical protein